MRREYQPLTPEMLRWVAQQVDPRARVTAVAPLLGGTTADMDRITVESPSGPTDVVLRRWPSEDRAEGRVAREAAGLAAVRGHGVPAPELLAMDEDGAETGVTCTLTSALPGEPDLTPADPASWLAQLATTQAAIHAVPDHPPTRSPGGPTGPPDRYGVRHRPLDWLTDSGLRDGAETGVTCTLTSALPGEPDLTPADPASWLAQLATTQAAIHAVPDHPPTRSPGGPTGPPDRYGVRHRPLDWLTDSGLRDAAREAASGPLAEETVLVHGDYQHFNVLWRDGRLTGVVDWPNAATGSRGSDVGHCRLNLAVLFDARTAEDYLVCYERAAGVRVDRRADLRALLCFALDWQASIPHQVAGRAPLDVAGMPDRVAGAVRSALDGMGH